MIPYIYSNKRLKDKDNIVNCNADLVVLDDRKPILVSLVDLSIKNKKIASDMVSYGQGSYATVQLKNREDISFKVNFSLCDSRFRYKSDKCGDFTHTAIYNTVIDDYCIDWNNEGKVSVITKWLRNKKYMPVTEEIVTKVISQDDDDNKYSNIVTECQVYTNNPIFKSLKVYKVSDYQFKYYLEKIDLFAEEDNFNWDNIEAIDDYLFAFLDPIKEKLQQNIKVLYNTNKIHPEMYNSKYKPFDGQLPIIQSGIEVLKKDRFIYLACEQGFGKTFTGSKINHLYFRSRGKNNITLLVAPAITLTQWKEELKNSIGEKIDIHIIKKTDDFIKWYNKTNMKADKHTYIIVGKETFKLGYKKIAGVNIKKRTLKVKVKDDYWYSRFGSGNSCSYKTENQTMELAICPDCGIPLKNPLRKNEDVFFTEKDFKGNPKKSNYKCINCGSVLWQATYNKTMKTSVIDFIKRKNIKFDSIIIDEAHEGNGDSLIGTSVRTLIRNHGEKIILLSGTSNNGYSSSLYNLCLALLPMTLKNNEVMDQDNFIKTYGTLMAVNKVKDGEYRASGRNQLKDSDFKEIEGINPIFFTKFLSQNFIFATLDDLGKDLPNIVEKYVPVQHDFEMSCNENRLMNDIKSANAFNSQWYNDTIVKHYINNPYGWTSFKVSSETQGEKLIQPKNLEEDILIPKEIELIRILKEELKQGRKCWIYTEFTGGGEYMQGENIPNRLQRILKQEGINTYQLKPSVSTYERKEIIEKNKDKYDVFICNPRLVNVGINMVWCPTYIVYIPSYHVSVISQAIRRGYRANSTQENHIYHLYYENSFENTVMKRYQRKRAEAESIEGKFSVQLENEDEIRTASKLGKRINDGIK